MFQRAVCRETSTSPLTLQLLSSFEILFSLFSFFFFREDFTSTAEASRSWSVKQSSFKTGVYFLEAYFITCKVSRLEFLTRTQQFVIRKIFEEYF